MSLFIKPLTAIGFSETKCHFMNKNQSQLNFQRAVQGLSDIKTSGFS